MRTRTLADDGATSREYLKRNREVWKKLGIRSMTTMVHDDDRSVVLADIEVRKHQRLVQMAEHDDTPSSILDIISKRNAIVPPTGTEIEEAEKLAKNSKEKRDVKFYLAQALHYRRKHTGLENNFDPEAAYAVRLKAAARSISYCNLSAAYYRLAKCLLEAGGKATVFGVKEDA